MNLERYEYKTGRKYKDFDFFSEGPKGIIKKVVRFTLMVSNGIPFYNLAFGDWNEETKKIDDITVTNNADADKVLATVAAIVVEFTHHFPASLVYAEGSTPSRTRLYQMGINKIWDDVPVIFEIYGVKPNDTIEPFSKNVNYDAFWLRRK